MVTIKHIFKNKFSELDFRLAEGRVYVKEKSLEEIKDIFKEYKVEKVADHLATNNYRKYDLPRMGLYLIDNSYFILKDSVNGAYFRRVL